MASTPQVGQRRSYDGALCTVRYIGEVAGTTGSWLGVEWDDPSRGKHDGQHKGVRYFTCKSKSLTAASFVRPTRPADAPQTFLSALQLKYAGDPTAERDTPKQVYFSGKVAEEVGFDKVRRQQAQLDELQFVILDGCQVACAYAQDTKVRPQTIGQVCPRVKELDLSRNVFNRIGTAVEICSELPLVKSLKANGNRFQDVLEDQTLAAANGVFGGVTELALEDTLLEWREICHVAAKFPSLTALHAGANQFSSLTPIPVAPFTSTLVSLHLEFNDFSSLADLAPLSAIPSLRNLLLKGNRISTVVPPSSSTTEAPVFGTNLHYLDISYNQVSSFSFVDALTRSFPGLTSLRFTHNPVYDNPDLDSQDSGGHAAPTHRKGVAKTEEAYMLVVGHMAGLKTLNFSNITPTDRADAEMFYLSRIARQLAAVPETAESEVLARHRRWGELCELYGEPAVVRQKELNPNFLEARLIKTEFYLSSQGEGEDNVSSAAEGAVKKRCVQIPKSFDIYAVKGIVGKLFGLPPLGLQLVWETGEWDPVGGFDDDAGDSSDEEELEAGWERKEEAGEQVIEVPHMVSKGGRWIKREVELRDGPRQFGYCVDGLEARVRVERR